MPPPLIEGEANNFVDSLKGPAIAGPFEIFPWILGYQKHSHFFLVPAFKMNSSSNAR